MSFRSYGLLATAIVVLALVNQSEGNMAAAFKEAAEAEKLLVSKDFQSHEEAIIMAATDIESLVAKQTIEDIRNQALQCQADGVPKFIVDIIAEAFLDGIRLLTTSARKANEAIDKSMELKSDPAAAAEVAKNGLMVDKELFYLIGVDIHDALGFVLALCGEGAYKKLESSIVFIQRAAAIAFGSLDITAKLVKLGFEAGNYAVEAGLTAGRETIAAAVLDIIVLIKEAYKDAFDAVRSCAANSSNKIDLVPGIINALKTNVTTNNPTALEATSKLDNYLESALKTLSKKPLINAAKVMHQGLSLTITLTADAISEGQKELQKIGTQSNKNYDCSDIREIVKKMYEKIYRASTGGFLGLGAAAKIAGKEATEKLIPAVLEVELGRITVSEILGLLEQIGCASIPSKGLVAAQGVLAATKACELAGNAMFSEYTDAADMAFEVLQYL